MGRFTENVALIVALILYVGTVFSLSLLTETSIFIVFVATLPILLYLIAFFYLINIDPHMGLLWLMPLLFPLIFLFIWYSKSLYILNMTDGPSVAVINILISYVINIFILLIMGLGRRESTKTVHHVQHHVHHAHNTPSGSKGEYPGKVHSETYSDKSHNSHHSTHSLEKELDDARIELHHTRNKLDEAHAKLASTKAELDDAKNVLSDNKAIVSEAKELLVNKENFNIKLRGIEDKCKAINFVIGRVYSDKRGGSSELREGLRIDPEWYNSFSEITNEFKDGDALKLYKLLEKIHLMILVLGKKENEVLDIGDAKLPVIRDEAGNDRIIDVLIKNDKDPVADYYSEAKEVCEKVMDYLKDNYGVDE